MIPPGIRGAARRGVKAALDPARAYATLWEEECDAAGRLVPTGVVFLTNRECPFQCVMCDLWVHTLDTTVPAGAIPLQVRTALAALDPVRQVKLYNAGSFFDPLAIPPADHAAIAAEVGSMERVIVEAHPAYLRGDHGDRCLRFRDRIDGRLEVAVGLETAHPDALRQLNKGMTLDAFDRAARFLTSNGIDLRVFVLLGAPFVPGDEDLAWTRRSIDLARERGATACTVIPMRTGTGAMAGLPLVAPPTLRRLEAAVEHGLHEGGMRVFADLWDAARWADCGRCSSARLERLHTMNREQRVPPAIECPCG